LYILVAPSGIPTDKCSSELDPVTDDAMLSALNIHLPVYVAFNAAGYLPLVLPQLSSAETTNSSSQLSARLQSTQAEELPEITL
jgi:hypothetical protein